LPPHAAAAAILPICAQPKPLSRTKCGTGEQIGIGRACQRDLLDQSGQNRTPAAFAATTPKGTIAK
jgi:hypothetical protein